eukprot:m.490083 g.490083  ORF g.490083 m.490083 type:complete len:79 (-) comp57244_c0_seq2:9-245(-)
MRRTTARCTARPSCNPGQPRKEIVFFLFYLRLSGLPLATSPFDWDVHRLVVVMFAPGVLLIHVLPFPLPGGENTNPER